MRISPELEKVFDRCLGHLNQLKNRHNPVVCLSLEKDLLLLRLLLTEIGGAKGAGLVYGQSKMVRKEGDILDLIKRGGEMMALDIFKAFPAISRRHLKRSLARLVETGLVRRTVVNNNMATYSCRGGPVPTRKAREMDS